MFVMENIEMASASEMVEIDFTLTREDIKKVNAARRKRANAAAGVAKARAIIWGITGALMVAALIIFYLQIPNFATSVAILLLLAATTLLVLGTLWLERASRKALAGLFPGPFVKQAFKLSPSAMHWRITKTWWQIPFDDVRYIRRAAHCLVIGLDDYLQILIPDRAFLSPSQSKRFVQILRKATQLATGQHRAVE